MIRIDFPEPDSPEWQEWREACERAQEALNKARLRAEPAEVQDTYKGQKCIYLNEGAPFHGKCAYCESQISTNQPGDIDHYRPKSRLTEGSRPVTCQGASGEEIEHPGYYWLAYDWRNLLPACRDCNTPSKWKTNGRLVGKGTEFPVRGFRAVIPGDETDEEPLLLNPLLDDIEDHSRFGPTGLAEALTDRGGKTIELLGLNEREALIKARLAEYGKAHMTLMHGFTRVINGAASATDHCVQVVKDIEAGRSPYSAAGRCGLREARQEAKELKDRADALFHT